MGGGVAALEALIALRRLAQERVELELVTPTPEWAYRPLAVAEPFGLGEAQPLRPRPVARDHGAALHLAGVQRSTRTLASPDTWDGRSSLRDPAGGGRRPARPRGPRQRDDPGAPATPAASGRVLRELDERRIRRVAFAVPAGASWPLPLYELALMTAPTPRSAACASVELSLVTPEQRPLELFGAAGVERRARAARRARHRVPRRTLPGRGARRRAAHRARPEPRRRARRQPAAPARPVPAGLPHDPDGFIPVDLHGLVEGELDVYAAGDATTCPIKQGGVATQQADAAAEAIAARARGAGRAAPFRPVLRGLLLTGATPRFLRAEVSGRRRPTRRGGVDARALVAAEQDRRALARALPRAAPRRARARPAAAGRPPPAGGLSATPRRRGRQSPIKDRQRSTPRPTGARRRPGVARGELGAHGRAAPGLGVDREPPPTSSTRSCMPIRPKPRRRWPGSKPRPSSRTLTLDRHRPPRPPRRRRARRRRA